MEKWVRVNCGAKEETSKNLRKNENTDKIVMELLQTNILKISISKYLSGLSPMKVP